MDKHEALHGTRDGATCFGGFLVREFLVNAIAHHLEQWALQRVQALNVVDLLWAQGAGRDATRLRTRFDVVGTVTLVLLVFGG